MAWGAEIDRQDKIYGLTPLHLAVLSGNGKNVKKLLIRGANRNIRVLLSEHSGFPWEASIGSRALK